MNVRVPALIKVAGLVDALNVSPTRAANIKNKIYYFLSLLTDTNDNYRLNSDNGGYHNLCSSELKKIIGNKDFYIIRELLLNPDDPIIEVDRSWHNPNGNNSSGYCQGYRITPKYNTGDVVYKNIPDKLSKVILKHDVPEVMDENTASKYRFLLNQLECNTITFDPLVYEYVFAWWLWCVHFCSFYVNGFVMFVLYTLISIGVLSNESSLNVQTPAISLYDCIQTIDSVPLYITYIYPSA